MFEQSLMQANWHRPKSVTIVGRFLVVAGCIGVLGTAWFFWELMRPFSPVAEYVRGMHWTWFVASGANMAFIAIEIVAGLGILRGKGWARILYLLGGAVDAVLQLWALGTAKPVSYGPLATSVVLVVLARVGTYVAVFALLLRPPANAFFASTHATAADA